MKTGGHADMKTGQHDVMKTRRHAYMKTGKHADMKTFFFLFLNKSYDQFMSLKFAESKLLH